MPDLDGRKAILISFLFLCRLSFRNSYLDIFLFGFFLWHLLSMVWMHKTDLGPVDLTGKQELDLEKAGCADLPLGQIPWVLCTHTHQSTHGSCCCCCLLNTPFSVPSSEALLHFRILLSHKNQNDAICRNMDGARDSHTKWSKLERERQIPRAITYMWILKYGTNDPSYKTETDSQT